MKLIINLHLLSHYSYLFLIQVKRNDHKVENWRSINYESTLHKSITFSPGHRVLGRYLPQKVLLSISILAFCKPIKTCIPLFVDETSKKVRCPTCSLELQSPYEPVSHT